MFKEYPKCLIQGEASVVVFDAAEEESARADGYQFHDFIGKPDASADEVKTPDDATAIERKKPGRKPKAG